jgi:protein-S-isoprenylcysteine O-methyltransferase Ste14
MGLFKLIYWLGIIGQIAIRAPYQKGWRGSDKKVQQVTALERGILFLLLIGGFIFPAVYTFTDWLSFADYSLPTWLGWLGAALMLLALYIFFAAHRDLKKYWSPSLELFKGHKLMTEGIYASIRHPMYASQFVYSLAQILLLQNWIAGPAGLVTFTIFYLIRVSNEEEMMLKNFGAEYKKYMQRTGRVFPKLGSTK